MESSDRFRVPADFSGAAVACPDHGSRYIPHIGQKLGSRLLVPLHPFCKLPPFHGLGTLADIHGFSFSMLGKTHDQIRHQGLAPRIPRHEDTEIPIHPLAGGWIYQRKTLHSFFYQDPLASSQMVLGMLYGLFFIARAEQSNPTPPVAVTGLYHVPLHGPTTKALSQSCPDP